MSKLVLTNAFALIGGHDFTSDTNQIQLNPEVDAQPATTFGSGGWREFVGGLKTLSMEMAGYWQSAASDAVDPEVFTHLGAGKQTYTVGPAATEGGTAYLFEAGKFSYSLLGPIGETTPFSTTCYKRGREGLIRGALLKARGAVTTVGVTGTAVELGAAASGQYLYATLHTLGTPGTTITIAVESAPDNTFAAATTRGSLGPVTTATGTWMSRIAGPITDTWWRLNITAITGTWTIASAVGIQ